MRYNRARAVSYAHSWAFSRNPEYFDFHGIGGDCTNFCSQCLYAGYPEMNYTPNTGWYYISASNRAAAWTGVEYFYRFLTANRGAGPVGEELPLSRAMPGDFVQLSFNGESFVHSLVIVEAGEIPGRENILIAAHTRDSDYRPLDSYTFSRLRLIHILDKIS